MALWTTNPQTINWAQFKVLEFEKLCKPNTSTPEAGCIVQNEYLDRKQLKCLQSIWMLNFDSFGVVVSITPLSPQGLIVKNIFKLFDEFLCMGKTEECGLLYRD